MTEKEIFDLAAKVFSTGLNIKIERHSNQKIFFCVDNLGFTQR